MNKSTVDEVLNPAQVSPSGETLLAGLPGC